jgi:hypothetical protein
MTKEIVGKVTAVKLVEPEVETVEETTNSAVLDAVKELTTTVADLITAINEMAKEYKLKSRAGMFDQKGVS